MTHGETKSILSMLRTAYTRFYQDIDEQGVGNAINLWQRMFADIDHKHVLHAVEQHIRLKEFPPVIADIYVPAKERHDGPGRFIQTGTDDAGMATGYWENRGEKS